MASGAQSKRRDGAWRERRLLPVTAYRLMHIRASWFLTTTDGSRNLDNFLAGTRHHAGEDANVDVGLQEMYRAIAEDRVQAGGVKTVGLSIVRTVDRTGSRPRGPVGGRTLKQNQRPCDPGAVRGD